MTVGEEVEILDVLQTSYARLAKASAIGKGCCSIPLLKFFSLVNFYMQHC